MQYHYEVYTPFEFSDIYTQNQVFILNQLRNMNMEYILMSKDLKDQMRLPETRENMKEELLGTRDPNLDIDFPNDFEAPDFEIKRYKGLSLQGQEPEKKKARMRF